MINSKAIITLCVFSSFLAGCDNAGKDKAKANEPKQTLLERPAPINEPNPNLSNGNSVVQYDLEISTAELPYLVVEMPKDGRFVISSHTVFSDTDSIWKYGDKRPKWWMTGSPSPVYAYGSGYGYGQNQKEVQLETSDGKYLFTVFSDLQDKETNSQLILVWDRLGTENVRLDQLLKMLMKEGGVSLKEIHRYNETSYLLIIDASASDECSSRTTSFLLWSKSQQVTLLYTKTANTCSPGDSYEKIKWTYKFDPATFKVVIADSPFLVTGGKARNSSITVDLKELILE